MEPWEKLKKGLRICSEKPAGFFKKIPAEELVGSVRKSREER